MTDKELIARLMTMKTIMNRNGWSDAATLLHDAAHRLDALQSPRTEHVNIAIDISPLRKEIEALEARAAKLAPLTDEQIDAIAGAMPDGLRGFCASWGYRQFARKVLEAAAQKSE